MKILIALLPLLAPVVQAQTACTKIADNVAHACWTAPTVNTDGSPVVLPLTYDVEQQSGSTWTKVATGLTATDWKSGTLTPGTYVYRVIAFAGGRASDPSTTGSKTAVNPTPNPPTGVIIAEVTFTVPATCDLSVTPARCTVAMR